MFTLQQNIKVASERLIKAILYLRLKGVNKWRYLFMILVPRALDLALTSLSSNEYLCVLVIGVLCDSYMIDASHFPILLALKSPYSDMNNLVCLWPVGIKDTRCRVPYPHTFNWMGETLACREKVLGEYQLSLMHLSRQECSVISHSGLLSYWVQRHTLCALFFLRLHRLAHYPFTRVSSLSI